MHSHDHSHTHNHNNRRALLISILITSVIMVLEFAGGVITNSLALMSDAGHMLSDAGSMMLSLAAIYLAAKPASPRKTFGFYRFEILAAFLNGVTLFLIAGFILWEAFFRFLNPPQVNSLTMVWIAVIGLAANMLSAWMLHSHGDTAGNINLRSAYLHILGDALGSVGAIAAGLLMYFFGWFLADPLISVGVSLLILRSAWSVVNEAVNVLLEGTPPTVSWDEVRLELQQIAGVKGVHDLHIWTIGSDRDSLTCHILIESGADSQVVLRSAIYLLKTKFMLMHSTIQVETEQFQQEVCQIGGHCN